MKLPQATAYMGRSMPKRLCAECAMGRVKDFADVVFARRKVWRLGVTAGCSRPWIAKLAEGASQCESQFSRFIRKLADQL